MSKGDSTRQHIIEKSAMLFNQKGFANTSMSDIMLATNLKKGGIYNHFSTKEEIRLESFKYNFSILKNVVQSVIKSETTSTAKLFAMIDFYRNYPLEPTIEGGCPIINSIVESHQVDINLAKEVSLAVDQLISSLKRIINNGKRFNEFNSNVNTDKSASIIYALIQGGILLSRGTNNQNYMNTICEQLTEYVKSELIIS